MKRIRLTQDKFALVDDEDFKKLNQWKWHLHSEGYAVRNNWPDKTIYMHREINKTPKTKLTDHIDGNRLNNTRINLRTANKSVNAINSGLRTTNKSGYKGVCWNKKYQKWEAYIWKDNKKYNLGLWNTILEAYRVRKAAEQRLHHVI